jgi:lysozyme family protein
MAASCYPESISRVLKSEGGYVNHPSDPGGETNYGITIKVARENGYAGPMRTLPLDTAKRIYKAKYADPVHFDEDPAGLDYTLFDYAVNSGPSRANKVVRRVCGLPDNAHENDLSLALSKRDPSAVIGSVNKERLTFLHSLPTWPTFGKGWAGRVTSVNAASLHMAAIGAAPIPSTLPPVAPSVGKGEVPKPDTGKIIVSTGTPTGAAGGATWWDWIVAHPYEAAIIAVFVLSATVVFVEWAAHRWQKAKQDAPTPGLIPVPEKG